MSTTTSTPSAPAIAGTSMRPNRDHPEPAGLDAGPAACNPVNPVTPRKPWSPPTPVRQAGQAAAAEGEAAVITNDSAAPRPLSDEPAVGVGRSGRVPLMQPSGGDKGQDRPSMDARKFHRVVLPGTDFDAWLAMASAKHPGDIGTSDNGEEKTITLVRARQIAHLTSGDLCKDAQAIIQEIQAGGVAHPGEMANARFDELILTRGSDVNGESREREAAPGSKRSATPAAPRLATVAPAVTGDAPDDSVDDKVDDKSAGDDGSDGNDHHEDDGEGTDKAGGEDGSVHGDADGNGGDHAGSADDPLDDVREEHELETNATGQSPDKPSAGLVPAPHEPPVAKSARTAKPGTPIQQVKAAVVTNGNSVPIGHHAETPAVGDASDHDLLEFQRLDAIVRKGWDIFVDSGVALEEIRTRELWKAGGHPSWNAYCRDVAGMSRNYANRKIRSAGVTKVIAEVVPIGTTSDQRVLPRSESQIRPLLRIKDDNRIPELWNRAVTREGGKQPTAETVKQIVAEALEEQDKPNTTAPTQHAETKEQRRARLFGRLEEAVRARDWDEVDLAVVELKQWL